MRAAQPSHTCGRPTCVVSCRPRQSLLQRSLPRVQDGQQQRQPVAHDARTNVPAASQTGVDRRIRRSTMLSYRCREYPRRLHGTSGGNHHNQAWRTRHSPGALCVAQVRGCGAPQGWSRTHLVADAFRVFGFIRRLSVGVEARDSLGQYQRGGLNVGNTALNTASDKREMPCSSHRNPSVHTERESDQAA